jgi:hypothetical protein
MAQNKQSPFIKGTITITLIVGLPGSGKTMLANDKVAKTGGIVIDDIKTRDDIIEAISEGYDYIYVTDPHLCRESVLTNAKNYIDTLEQTHTLECIFFKNNPEQCLKNVEARNDGRDVKETIKRYTKIYRPPSNALDVWEPK